MRDENCREKKELDVHRNASTITRTIIENVATKNEFYEHGNHFANEIPIGAPPRVFRSIFKRPLPDFGAYGYRAEFSKLTNESLSAIVRNMLKTEPTTYRRRVTENTVGKRGPTASVLHTATGNGKLPLRRVRSGSVMLRCSNRTVRYSERPNLATRKNADFPKLGASPPLVLE